MDELRRIILHESDIEEGTATKFWKAIEERLNEFLEDIHLELEDLDNGQDYGTFKRLGGNAQTVRRILLLPEIFRDEIFNPMNEKEE